MKNIISTIGAILLIVVFLWLGIKLPEPATDASKKEVAEMPPPIEFTAPRAEAKKIIPSATTTPRTINTIEIDLTPLSLNTESGVCYKLKDNDGEGFTYLRAYKGSISAGITCDP